MIDSTHLRGVSALTLVLPSVAALAQEALPTIDIAGEAEPSSIHDARRPAEKETGYVRSSTFSATKTDAPLLDTPVAVQIVPHEVIVDKQALNTMEAVKNVSGVQSSPGTYYDSYLIRGFKMSSTWRNGLQLEKLIGGEEIAFTDRVEIVKGPASVLYGRLEPGGFVNVVTKRPQEEFRAEAETRFGSWGLSRTTVDITGPANDEKTLLYRAMGAYDHSDSFTDFEHRDNGAVALFLTFRPSQNFEFNSQVEHYQKKQGQPDGLGKIPVNSLFDGNGRPMVIPGFNDRPLNLSRRFSIGDPALWSDFPYVVHRTVVGYDWTFKFDDKWKITNRFHYVDNDENQTGFFAYGGFDGANVARNFSNYMYKRRIVATNLDLTGEVLTGPIKHKPLIGVDWYSYQDDSFGVDASGTQPLPLNVYSPAYGNLTGYLHYLADSGRGNALFRSRERDFGVYAQDQISFWDDRIHILLGGRWDKSEVNYSRDYGEADAPCFPACTAYPLDHRPDRPKLSPRVGVLFKLADDTSIFGSYVRSFGANNGVSSDGTIYPPEEALQWEAGIKKLWLDGKVTTSVTLFDITKKNVLEPDPANPNFSRAAGTVASRGIEVDLAGNLTENLSVIASYTFDSAKIVDDLGNGDAGKRFNSVAPHVGNIWAKWDTAPGAQEGWEFGGGVYATDDRWGNDANSWKLPGYVKLDAMGAYRAVVEGHKVKFQLNIKNLTDRRYFEYSDRVQSAYYAAPRTFVGSVNFQW